MMFFNKIALVAVLATSAYAQSSATSTSPATSSPSLSACLLSCLTGASQCTSYTDVTCVCTNTAYQQAVTTCLQSSCTADDLAAAQALQSSICSSVSSSIASSSSSQISSASSRISSLLSSASSRAASPTSTGSSGATGLSVNLLIAGGTVLLGVIGGGLLVF